LNRLDRLILGFKRKHIAQKTIIRVVKEFTKLDKDSLSVNYRELLRVLDSEELVELAVRGYVEYLLSGKPYLLKQCVKELKRRGFL